MSLYSRSTARQSSVKDVNNFDVMYLCVVLRYLLFLFDFSHLPLDHTHSEEGSFHNIINFWTGIDVQKET